MASFNRVIIAGNVVRDIEIRYTPRGAAVADMSIAVNRKWRDEASQEMREEVTYVEVAIWGKTAESCAKYLSKGSACLVEGRLEQQSWEDKATGQKRSKLRVVAESVQFIGAKREGGDAPRQQSAPPRQPQTTRRTAADALDDAQREQQAGDDDIPFN